MEYSQVLDKLVNEVVAGIVESTDEKVLFRYQRILDYLNIILEFKGDEKCMKN